MPYRELPDRTLTTATAVFSGMEVGGTIILYLPWHVRLWNWIRRVIFRRKLKPYKLGTYTITEIVNETQVRIGDD